MIQTWIPKGICGFVTEMKGLGIGQVQNERNDADQGTIWKDIHSSWIWFVIVIQCIKY
jgi:hypothetical protein